MRRPATWLGVTLSMLLFAPPIFAQPGSTLQPDVTQLDVPDAFGAPRSTHVGPTGQVHVVFSEPPFVRRWIVATGEWQVVPLTGAPDSFVPSRLGWSGDRLWAIDRRQTALWREGDGESEPSFQAVYLPRPGAGPRGYRVLAVDEAGRLIVGTAVTLSSMAAADPRSAAMFEELPPEIELPRPVDRLPVWVVQPDGVVVDTVTTVSTANRGMMLPVSGGLDASGTGRIEWLTLAQPLPDDPLVTASPTGSLLVVERPAEHGDAPPLYRLRRFEPDGSAVAVHPLSYVPVPVRGGWADSTIAALAHDLVERGEDPATATETASRVLHQPEHVPGVSAAHVGPDGWTWVRRYGLNEEGEQEWEVVDPAGTRVGVVSLDARLDLMAVHGQTAWARTSNDSEPGTIWRIDARRLALVPD